MRYEVSVLSGSGKAFSVGCAILSSLLGGCAYHADRATPTHAPGASVLVRSSAVDCQPEQSCVVGVAYQGSSIRGSRDLPLANCTVIVDEEREDDSESRHSDTALTDENGVFSLSGVPAGQYAVKVYCQGRLVVSRAGLPLGQTYVSTIVVNVTPPRARRKRYQR